MTGVPEGAKFAYMHEGHIAFYLTERPNPGSIVHPSTFIQIDGAPVGEVLRCGTCGAQRFGLMTSNIREL